MDVTSTKLTIETSDGLNTEVVACKDLVLPKTLVDKFMNGDFAGRMHDILNCEIRDSDVFLATYPKAGTHWAWEVINMLLQGSSAYIKSDKESLFLDLASPDTLEKFPSPRVINSHFTPRCLPRGILEKGAKIVHVCRNAKDVLVSFYNHSHKFNSPFADTFERKFRSFTGAYGVYLHCSWAHYVKEWEHFTRQHPQQILNIHYEDMKEDPVREIRKINEFLQCNRKDELIRDIADACSFANLKKADVDKDHTMKLPTTDIMFRKGEVGDWKNWLTVAQNEQMDQWLEENLENTDLKFRYTL